jgi:hypothetical protein
MTSAQDTGGNAEPVERFKPTSGMAVGYIGLLFALVAVGYVVLFVHTVAGLRVGLGAVFIGIVVWITQLRPRATAYRDRLLLKNSLRDHLIPLVLIDEVTVRQTLNVWVGEQRYVCVGIGASLRSMFKENRRKLGPTGLAPSRWGEYAAEEPKPESLEQTSMTYEKFVVTRIDELVDQAKKAQPEGAADGERPVRRWAWPEVAGLVLSGVAFLVSFLF